MTFYLKLQRTIMKNSILNLKQKIMKNTSLLLLCLIALFSFTSCNNDENTNVADDQMNSSLSAKIDGVPFSAPDLNAFAIKINNGEFTSYTLTGIGGIEFNETISISIPLSTGVGTYGLGEGAIIDGSPLNIGLYTKTNLDDPANPESWFAETGELEITSVNDDRIIGIFNFITRTSAEQTEQKNITEGVFNLRIL